MEHRNLFYTMFHPETPFHLDEEHNFLKIEILNYIIYFFCRDMVLAGAAMKLLYRYPQPLYKVRALWLKEHYIYVVLRSCPLFIS